MKAHFADVVAEEQLEGQAGHAAEAAPRGLRDVLFGSGGRMLRRNVIGTRGDKLFGDWYHEDAVMAVSQAAGRAYRGPGDHGVIILVGLNNPKEWEGIQEHIRDIADTHEASQGWARILQGAGEFLQRWRP
ncbi:hypothetical protein GPECTOR_2159g1131 [Gonium pectorale]|uniref:ATP-dependent helicase C-terminal domain-containing protein n=1 Tax=Gonium pectorale TaxID=33097 RepID=A0A150FTA0_GONPE|nr:hypothetical protein GPECTOR_2159g1131 [Gonium pectorale]|eukprot:KXZ40816.1 hypothetical protein GPECTOR_2159g1131 [Gonium pectorale]